LRDRGLRLGVLTENWPSVEIAYRRLGLRSLFQAFVISSQEGRLKDDPELFAIAAARMGLPAEAMLFLDDWPPHVQTALAAGFQGAVLDRDGKAPAIPGLRYLTGLHDVERLVMAAPCPLHRPDRQAGGSASPDMGAAAQRRWRWDLRTFASPRSRSACSNRPVCS
jgi:Haloacid dehalogenase-like hydrolase